MSCTSNQASKGEEHYSSRLTDDDVRFIRANASGRCPWKESQTETAVRFGVTQSTISKVVRGATWRHVR